MGDGAEKCLPPAIGSGPAREPASKQSAVQPGQWEAKQGRGRAPMGSARNRQAPAWAASLLLARPSSRTAGWLRRLRELLELARSPR